MASKPLTNQSSKYSCEIFIVDLTSAMEDCSSEFSKWETDTKAKTATWNKIKI